MKVDGYTKAVLTVIALALSAIAIEQLSLPRARADTAGGNAKFDHIAYQNGIDHNTFFDKSTGDIWYYGGAGSQEKPTHEKLIKLGEQLEKDR